MFIIIARGSVDKGFDVKTDGPTSFIRSPIKIRKVILSPTENRNVSTLLDFSSLNILRRIKPGKKIR
jgi:hypothetical protein